ncbi:sulfatase-like hydrolase/transferase [Luteolibacter marinus]|uniref:sulfatase-like hydrolase/transferase n=1 Tax=Luteolibacter marinus TaxID=2776705 RepID=UPI001D0344E8|nr:sulfatase-like hydrolase/transferase [Luteolibacter marinus]
MLPVHVPLYLRPLLAVFAMLPALAGGESRPNVLFIALDDLNDWIGCMEGHPQTVTPNLDRLAADGMLFTNAHCAAPACNPSRISIFSGRSPHKTGIYTNAQKLRDVLPDVTLLPEHFSKNGYHASGSGKMLHYIIDARSWDEYFPEKSTEMPIPDTLYPDKRPLSLPRAGPWQYEETDWGPLDTSDEKFGGDYTVSQWVGGKLAQKHDEPFFLACGIYRPHEPWFVPKKYFEKFPLESIQLPPGYKEGDLDDLSDEAKKLAENRYFPHILEQGQWKQGVQSYLASIHFADAMLGRVLDALEKGPNKDNTIVVLWSDHGWHLGEKQHWQKYTAWRACTRVPLMVKVPAGISPALPGGTRAGIRCDAPVSLLGLYPTLTELCGLPPGEAIDGRSLVPLLKDPTSSIEPAVMTYLHDGGSVGVSTKDWRYIRYKGGAEELYHTSVDPYEWDNLASTPAHAAELKRLRALVPAGFSTVKEVKVKDLPDLPWRPVATASDLPPSKPDGTPMRIAFVNHRNQTVQLHWMNRQGHAVDKGVIEPNQQQELKGRPGSVWAISDETGAFLGYFEVVDRPAKGVIR